MPTEDLRRRSRWMIRALEWDDPRARYPNLWHEGMPCRILAFESVASRLRLGDLIAVYHPASQRHGERAEKFVGIARVRGLAGSHEPGSAWIDLESAHRFDPPLDLGMAPSRVFLCCDPGWPTRDVSLFRRVFEAAVAAGWKPTRDELESPAAGPAREAAPGTEEAEHEPVPRPAAEPPGVADHEAAPEPLAVPWAGPSAGSRLFGGVDFSGDMRDPKDRTWFALLELRDERLTLVRLEPTGRSGLQALLRNPDAALLHAEAIGLDFPFGLPIPFAESLLGGPFPEEGWWALARKLERLSRPDYLIALQAFRDAHGELKRLTDERADAFSPLHRVNPDLGPMTYQGIRMLAEERSRYALRPFETAKGKLLLEVYPGGAARRLGTDHAVRADRSEPIAEALARSERLPVVIDPAQMRRCLARRDAMDAVVAARCAAVAVLSGETERTPEELAPGHGEQVRREGWIYGLDLPSPA